MKNSKSCGCRYISWKTISLKKFQSVIIGKKMNKSKKAYSIFQKSLKLLLNKRANYFGFSGNSLLIRNHLTCCKLLYNTRLKKKTPENPFVVGCDRTHHFRKLGWFYRNRNENWWSDIPVKRWVKNKIKLDFSETLITFRFHGCQYLWIKGASQ